jgi:hypothetical protein
MLCLAREVLRFTEVVGLDFHVLIGVRMGTQNKFHNLSWLVVCFPPFFLIKTWYRIRSGASARRAIIRLFRFWPADAKQTELWIAYFWR